MLDGVKPICHVLWVIPATEFTGDAVLLKVRENLLKPISDFLSFCIAPRWFKNGSREFL